jgi:hypothetical protein
LRDPPWKEIQRMISERLAITLLLLLLIIIIIPLNQSPF